MKKRIIFWGTMLFFNILAYSQQMPKATTVKSNGTFQSSITTEMKTVSMTKLDAIIDRFISEYNNDMKSLFLWALTGLKLQGEKDDFIEFNLKSHKYNAQNQIVEGLMAMNIGLMNKKFENVKYKTTLKKIVQTPEKILVTYQMLECEEVISTVTATMNFSKKDDKTCSCVFNVSTKLSFPYSLMSIRQYKDNIEWRFVGFLKNLQKEIEK